MKPFNILAYIFLFIKIKFLTEHILPTSLLHLSDTLISIGNFAFYFNLNNNATGSVTCKHGIVSSSAICNIFNLDLIKGLKAYNCYFTNICFKIVTDLIVPLLVILLCTYSSSVIHLATPAVHP